ncbi:MAG TPA: tRNA lysidine(34) synthetase TilS [Anaerolineaceae bacterium]|nr:tRNA lysidine(34) synthetase TilS [Anaerolineaceae bacterium]
MHLARYEKICRENCRLQPDQVILVGLSGGADSLCLADLLDRLGYPLAVAYFNHGLRPEAAHEAETIAQLATSRGWQYLSTSAPIAEMARQQRLSIEAAARQARYTFLFDAARRVGAQAVAVGHQADDQVETVLLHLLRGSGLNGLRAMRWRAIFPDWDPQIPLVRPLLGTWRTEIAVCCADRGLVPLEDATNAEQHFTRNRIRAQLLPMLETYNPQIKSALWRLAFTLQGDFDILTSVVDTTFQSLLRQSDLGRVAMDHHTLAELEDGLLAAVLRRAAQSACPSLDDLDFDAVQRSIVFVRQPIPQGRVELTSGLVIFREGDQIILAQWDQLPPEPAWPQISEGSAIPIPVPGELSLPGGWFLTAQYLESARLSDLRPNFGDPFACWLNAAALPGPLLLRTWQPGDRFNPLGMANKTVKLADYWTNVGLPVRARSNWPLVVSGSQIIWVPGYRPAHSSRLTEAPQAVIHLQLTKTG